MYMYVFGDYNFRITDISPRANELIAYTPSRNFQFKLASHTYIITYEIVPLKNKPGSNISQTFKLFWTIARGRDKCAAISHGPQPHA